jgi:hypothetical protein
MKKSFIFIALFSSLGLFSQSTFFSDAIIPSVPSALVVVGEDLFVAVVQGDPAIRKINLNDPTTSQLVADFPDAGGGGGVWKMAYHEATNSIYAHSFDNSFIHKVDLNLPLPVIPEEIVLLPFGTQGMVMDQDTLYIASNDVIYTMDINIGAPSLTPYYEDPNTNLEFYNPAIYNNELYFAERIMNDPDFNIMKIPLNTGNPQKTLVATLGGVLGAVQSSIIVQSNLYIGVEITSPHIILKLDLNESLPIDAEFLVMDLPGAPIGLAFKGDTFYVSEGNTRTILSFMDPNLSIEEFIINELTIYPNPTNDIVFLSNLTYGETFTIYTVNGQVLSKGKYFDNGIDVSALSSGIYFINTEVDGLLQTKKLIKN